MSRRKKKAPLYQRLLTAAQAAYYFGVGEGCIYTLCQMRQLPHLRIGSNALRFDIRELRAWIKRKLVWEAPPLHLLPSYLQARSSIA